ncbi:hypothetical protein PGT21_008961 [Puccinia graminis f. sp. tritici]|nr:hypothetical protein PGT21_008961 [Puccinia graminis f. sp. tritici]KAA1123682.1 hypothetical protein PGTUg99_027116 [Puccinia graminis f. sp. tritici]
MRLTRLTRLTSRPSSTNASTSHEWLYLDVAFVSTVSASLHPALDQALLGPAADFT